MSANMIVTTRRSSGATSLLLFPSNAAPARLFPLVRVSGACETRVTTGVVDSVGEPPFCAFSDAGARDAPHSMQNFANGRFTVPQFGQTTSRLPHSRQNFALGGLRVWQFGQRMMVPAFLLFASGLYFMVRLSSIVQHPILFVGIIASELDGIAYFAYYVHERKGVSSCIQIF
jgi:hypothetical protein